MTGSMDSDPGCRYGPAFGGLGGQPRELPMTAWAMSPPGAGRRYPRYARVGAIPGQDHVQIRVIFP